MTARPVLAPTRMAAPPSSSVGPLHSLFDGDDEDLPTTIYAPKKNASRARARAVSATV